MRIPVKWGSGSILLMTRRVEISDIDNFVNHLVVDEFIPRVAGSAPYARLTPREIIDITFERFGPHPALLDLGFTIH